MDHELFNKKVFEIEDYRQALEDFLANEYDGIVKFKVSEQKRKMFLAAIGNRRWRVPFLGLD